jgi:hypothetical protein
MATTEIRVCVTCGIPFPVLSKYVKRGEGRCCSKSCSAKQARANDSPAVSTASLNAKARLIYIERSGMPSCNHCGTVPADVHHLNENLYDNSPENLAAMCRSCHVAYHNHLSPKRNHKAA